MSPLSLGGLASGIDTDSIITQLMAVEGQSKTRLQLADTRAVARQTGLRDLASRLGALRDAANALKSTTTWADVQQLSSSGPAFGLIDLEAERAPAQLMSLGAVLALHPGDILRLDGAAEEGAVTLFADAVALHRAKLGRNGRRRAVGVLGPVEQDP